MSDMKDNWPSWEVFVRGKRGLDHRHVGSLIAPDPELALLSARDVYTRRSEGVSLWVVQSSDIVASRPQDAPSFYGPSDRKTLRHAASYDGPDSIEH